MIKKDLLELAPLGIVGFHPAGLPSNRGRYPIILALVLELKKTASTFFFMDASADTSDILSQQEISITDQDDARTLYDKEIETALVQIEKFLPKLATGTFQRINQKE